MDPVSVEFRGRDEQLNRTLQNIEKSMGSFASNTKRVVGAALGVFSVRTLINFGQGLITAASEGEAATAKLNQALQSTGNVAGVTTEEISEYATQLQAVTKFEGDATVAAASMLAQFKNVKGDVFKGAISASQDLATAMGTDLEGAMFKVGKALDNPIKGLGALRGAGVRFSDDQVTVIKNLQETGRLAEAQGIILGELEGKFGGAAEAAGATFGGKLESLKNRLGDVAESIGSYLIDAINKLMPVIEGVVGWVEQFITDLGDSESAVGSFVQSGLQFMIDGFKMLLTVGVAVFSGVRTVMENWQETAELVFKSVMLAAVVYFETMKHFFTEVLPALLSWFSDNWREVFTDAYNLVTTIFSNMWTNVEGFFKALYSYLSGGEFDFEWTGLTEGFESALEEMPKIAERRLGPLEEGLREDVSKLGSDIAGKFKENFDKDMAAVGLTGETTIKQPKVEGGSGAKGPGGAPRDFAGEAAKIKAAEDAKKADEKAKKAEEKAAEKETEARSDPFEGLKELFTRIQTAAAKDPATEAAKKTAAATEKTASASERTAKATEEMAKKNGKPNGSTVGTYAD